VRRALLQAKRRLLGSEQQNRRQLEEDRNSGGDSRLEQVGNQLGHFSSQSKNQLATREIETHNQNKKGVRSGDENSDLSIFQSRN
jgi:hypothetical protein